LLRNSSFFYMAARPSMGQPSRQCGVWPSKTSGARNPYCWHTESMTNEKGLRLLRRPFSSLGRRLAWSLFRHLWYTGPGANVPAILHTVFTRDPFMLTRSPVRMSPLPMIVCAVTCQHANGCVITSTWAYWFVSTGLLPQFASLRSNCDSASYSTA